jgi:prolyl 4-hydroxylase
LHLDCDAFADQGHCDSMPGQMAVYCPIACNSCHLRDRKERCKKENIHGQHARPSPTDNPNIEYMTYNRSAPIYAPGDLNRMFESIIPRFQKRYAINILSRSPYVVTIDDFLSGEEVRALTKHVDGWERSTDTGQLNALGASGKKLSTGRTSSNAWCAGQCESHPVVTNIYNKIAEITKVPRSYYETFQVLRYEIGQKYEVHHDNGQQSQTNENSSGPRILTFFLYLSDVDEGGETTFPALGLSVQPKRGRALLWPSVLNEDVLKNDGRTLHEAKPVIRGRKFAANTWIHAYDFTLASQWMCSGGVGSIDANFAARLIT